MNFLRIKFQKVINRIRAFRSRFRRPRQILEAEAGIEYPEPFQLLDLPEVVLRKVVLHLNPATLIDISMTSDTFNEKMKETKLSADFFTWVLCRNKVILFCHLGMSTFTIECNHTDPRIPFVKRKIGGKTRLVNLRQTHGCIEYKFKLSQSDRSEEEIKITTHLLSIIKPQAYNLFLRYGTNLKSLFVWKFSMNFDYVTLEPDYATYRFGPLEALFIFQDVVVKNIGIEFKQRPEDWRKEERARLLDTTQTMQLRSTIQRITVWNLDLFSAENIINSEIKSLFFISYGKGRYGYRNDRTFNLDGQLNKLVFY